MSKAKFVGVFGKRNSGKSSLINIFAGQQVAIVSETPGTTTDPVKKRMEIFGIGPVVLIDTAGIDDSGDLGNQRVAKTKEVISQIDIALILFTNNQLDRFELDLIEQFRQEDIPFIIIHNQSDIIPLDRALAVELTEKFKADVLEFSCSLLDSKEQDNLVELLTSLMVKAVSGSPYTDKTLFEGLVEKDDVVILVCPIDSEAPEGRLILPQMNAIRDLLDRDATAVVLQPRNLEKYIKEHRSKIKMVVTDSQAFLEVDKAVPAEIPLTGFSVILARSKGNFHHYVKGTPYIDKLEDGDRVLILESCSHHSSCEDIGRVKIPKLLEKRTGKKIEWDIVAGLDPIPKDIERYKLVIQCGGCMITNRQLAARLRSAIKKDIAVTNYGITLAYCMGIYDRATAMFRE
ncbi:MAG: [FeFe] hydrogenase H-cluster maturation GTPase HydF [Bacteroidetes bacterium HGW-Bacteroidetes-7]|jgi:[FeFe] hydrogenase H-cluster maturation GTPase HydF|nr:MAG: [FeFe] hydrogenase H-cluster maturation GTPase HydF [Bacteroidetes bacterium HGW-Bacteroidetes-7]